MKMNIIEEIKTSFKSGTYLTRLIYINVAVFLALHIVIIFLFLLNKAYLSTNILSFFAVPAEGHSLVSRPWTPISYMFLHKDFFHLLFNLLWLYWFGKIFLQYIDNKSLLAVYLLGGLAGAAFFIISYNILPVLHVSLNGAIALGASAAVMAVVMAIAFYAPEHNLYLMFLGPVKIIWIALIGFVLSSVIDFSVNTGGKIAHMGGALTGYYFAVKYKQGKNITIGFQKILDKLFTLFRRNYKRKMKVTHKRPFNDLEYNTRKVEKQKEIDRILDKISSKGYDSLSAEEKETLFKSGNNK